MEAFFANDVGVNGLPGRDYADSNIVCYCRVTVSSIGFEYFSGAPTQFERNPGPVFVARETVGSLRKELDSLRGPRKLYTVRNKKIWSAKASSSTESGGGVLQDMS